MRLFTAVRWNGILLLAPAVIAVAFFRGTDQSRFYGAYTLFPFTQGLAAVGFAGPLLAGWCAWNTGKMQRVLMQRPLVRPTVVAAAQPLAVGIVMTIGVLVGSALALAGPFITVVGVSVTLMVCLCLAACAALGAAMGLAVPRAVAAPAVMVALFAWLILPISTLVPWLRNANTASVLTSCCSPDQQPSYWAVASSVAVSSIWTGGCIALLSVRLRRALSLAGVAGVVVAGLIAGFLVGRYGSPDGLQARTTAVACSGDAGLQWCLWPEDRGFGPAVGQRLRASRQDVKSLGLTFPASWSESSTGPTDAASLTVGPHLGADDLRYALAVAMTQWWKCDDMTGERLTPWLAMRLGVPADVTAQRSDPEVFAAVQRLTASSTEQQHWVDQQLQSCPDAR